MYTLCALGVIDSVKQKKGRALERVNSAAFAMAMGMHASWPEIFDCRQLPAAQQAHTLWYLGCKHREVCLNQAYAPVPASMDRWPCHAPGMKLDRAYSSRKYPKQPFSC